MVIGNGLHLTLASARCIAEGVRLVHAYQAAGSDKLTAWHRDGNAT